MGAISRTSFRVVGLIATALALSACSQSDLRLSPDFGAAVRQDVAAQIADPDAKYVGIPAPGSNGARVDLAQRRYEQNQVIQPALATTSNTLPAAASNGAGNSGSSIAQNNGGQ